MQECKTLYENSRTKASAGSKMRDVVRLAVTQWFTLFVSGGCLLQIPEPFDCLRVITEAMETVCNGNAHTIIGAID